MEKGTKFQVLDHGYVTYIDSMGTDESIVEAARMSTGRGFISWDRYERCEKCDKVRIYTAGGETKNIGQFCVDNGTDHKWTNYPQGDMGLLDNLWRNKHATPFEMVELSIEVQAPIMVFREWHRHRTQSYNEFSARYAQMPDLHYLPKPERIQKQSASNKQGSAEVYENGSDIISELQRQQEEVYGTYDAWVGNGIAKEVARLNTPVSRYSKMRAKTDLRNWFAFANLRERPGAQWEIRQYANIVGDIIKSLWPRCWSLFEEYDLYGARFSRTEMAILLRNIPIAAIEMDAERHLSGAKLKELMTKLKEGGSKILP